MTLSLSARDKGLRGIDGRTQPLFFTCVGLAFPQNLLENRRIAW